MSIPIHGLIFIIVLGCDVFQTIYSTQESPNGLTMKMIYRDSPESPLHRTNQTEDERIQNLIHASKLRYKSMILATTNNFSSMVTNPGGVQTLISTQAESTYLVQLGIGQFSGSVIPYLPYYLVMDTGGQTTWLQCEWCKRCFRQRDPYYPWSRSQTYNPFACPACPPTARCPQEHCTFSLSYFDGSSVKGNWARETFTFLSNGTTKTFPNIIFGCGVEMHVPLLERIPNNIISGSLGMGYGSKSFATQLKTRGLGTFSYCLHKLSTPSHSTAAAMFLRFADHIPQAHGMVSTPLINVANQHNYYVNLLHVSVANTRLNIPNGMFAVKADNSGGVIIDSGAAVSHIVSDAYQILLNSIATYIESNNRNLKKIVGAHNFFEACWVGPSDPSQVKLPSVTFHFRNADMVVQPSSVFYLNKTQSPARYCLAILRGTPSRSVSIIGAYQQGNQRIIYDLNRNQLIFKAVDCSQPSN